MRLSVSEEGIRPMESVVVSTRLPNQKLRRSVADLWPWSSAFNPRPILV